MNKKSVTILGISIWKLFAYFIIYSFIGYIIETLFGIATKGVWESRQSFLYGPFCGIYGIGAITITLLSRYFNKNKLTLFVGGFLVGSVTEYTISFLVDTILHTKWWDYSNRKFNINGRVCLNNAFFFGVLGTFLVYFANPFFEGLLLKINTNTLNIISLILLIIFTIDFIISTYASFKLKNSLSKIDKDSTEEIKEKIKEKIDSKFLNRRIFKAYPKYKINIIKRLEEYRKEKIEKK